MEVGIYLIPKGSFVTLKMKDSHQKVTLVREEEIEIKDEESDEVLSLSDIEMVRLFFGASPENFEKNKEQNRFLRAIFPLNFYIWWLDHV